MKKNKKHKPKCQCATCALMAQGMTPTEAHAAMRRHMDEQLKLHGWIAHYVAEDPDSPTGFNGHTHGLAEKHGHPDFQIVVAMPPRIVHAIFITLADRVKAGERFETDQKVAEVIEGAGRLDGKPLLVKMIDAVENDRPVLRVVMPDVNGNLDLGQIADPFAAQYDKRGAIAVP